MSKTKTKTALMVTMASLLASFLPIGNASAGQGHDAGYQWAQDKGIDDPSNCGGNSQSFIEGCEEAALEMCVEQCVDDEGLDEGECEERCDY